MMVMVSRCFFEVQGKLLFLLIALPSFLIGQDTVKILYGDSKFMYRVEDPQVCYTDSLYYFHGGPVQDAVVVAYYDIWYRHVAAQITYVNGKRQGAFCVYDSQSNQILYRMVYADDVELTHEYFYCSGICRSIFNYNREGEESGVQVKFYESGQVASIEYLIDGEYVGVQRYWYEDGKLQLQLPTYSSGKDQIGYQYWPNGNLKSEFIVRENSRQYVSRFDSLGNLIMNIGSKKWLDYHQNGRIAVQVPMKNGFMNGTYTAYDTAGKIVETKLYVMGKLNGRHIKYKNGVVSYSCEYRRGLKDGKEISYDSGGNALSTTIWRSGQLYVPAQNGRKFFNNR